MLEKERAGVRSKGAGVSLDSKCFENLIPATLLLTSLKF